MDLTGAALAVEDPSSIGSVRREAMAGAQRLGFGEEAGARAGIVATELARNVLKHGGGGWCFLAPSEHRGGAALSVVAVDRGPGMSDPAAALADGYSTAGTPGTGLGAVRRLSLSFDLYSRPGAGAVVAARVGPPPPPAADGRGVEIGGVVRAKPGQEVSGDLWSFRRAGPTVLVLLADGLGHGPDAAEAAAAAAAAFGRAAGTAAADVVEEVHGALHGTRGAAVAVAAVDGGARRVRYAGIGNISGRLVLPDGARSLVSMNGTAGVQARSLREFEYSAPDGGLLVLHSDGLSARWSLDDYPGAEARDPAVIAALLFRDFGRARDDASAVVLRIGAAAADGASR